MKTVTVTQDLMIRFISLGLGHEPVNGYDDRAATRKDFFHRVGTNILRDLAEELGLPRSSVVSNKGGVAIGGEVTLYSTKFFVQLSANSSLGILYRRCNGPTDYIGGPNQWAPWVSLLSLDTLAARIKTAPAGATGVTVTSSLKRKRA